jgi:hypothetical protein
MAETSPDLDISTFQKFSARRAPTIRRIRCKNAENLSHTAQQLPANAPRMLIHYLTRFSHLPAARISVSFFDEALGPKHRRNAASLELRRHQWISARSREVAYDQIVEASAEKLAQAVVFWLMRQRV